MALTDFGIMVYRQNFDEEGHDLGEVSGVLGDSKKKGLTLTENQGIVKKTVTPIDPAQVIVFRESDVVNKSALGRAAVGLVIAGPLGGVIGGISGTGKKDAWYLQIKETDGKVTTFRLKNEGDGRRVEKCINKKYLGQG